jgi:hypothetical protein
VIVNLPLQTADQIQVIPTLGDLPPATLSPKGYVYIVEATGELYYSDGFNWFNLSQGQGASAPGVTYAPGTPANWTTVPNNVQSALDYLVATAGLNVDGGTPSSIYGGLVNLNGGAP